MSTTHSEWPAADVIIRSMQRWIDEVVIGLNLCPFAARVRRHETIGIEVASAVDTTSVLHHLGDIATGLVEGRATAPEATTLLVLPRGFEDFNDYLDLVALCEELLDATGFTGEVQLASFHPFYRFADEPPDDPANYTNRSPYPALHLLQEAAVTQALEHFPDPEGIPLRNAARLRALDPQAALAVLSFCQPA